MELPDTEEQRTATPVIDIETSEKDVNVPGLSMGTSQIVSSIKRLYELHCTGALTADEFQKAKQTLLEDIRGDAGFSYSSNFSVQGSHSGEARQRHKFRQSKDSIDFFSGKTPRSRSCNPTRSSRTTSSSSSSTSSSEFMVAPRAKLWLPLNAPGDSEANREFTDDGASTGVWMPPGRFDFPSEWMRSREHSGPVAPGVEGRMGVGGPPRPTRLYGTFTTVSSAPPQTEGEAKPRQLRLESSTDVIVKYFNSRGASGDRFEDVILQPEELRSPLIMREWIDDKTLKREATPHVPKEDAKEDNLASPDDVRLPTPLSSDSTNSNLELYLNWYWIDMVGRDPSQQKYCAVLRSLTERFNLSESFLIDREHTLVLPQICIAPDRPSQFLICLRVASPQIALDDDNVMELTNRWIIVVDLEQKLIITIHRLDCASMANMRQQWKSLMKRSAISFQEFLVKILDEAIHTYKESFDVHADLLDACESKLFALEPREPKKYDSVNEQYGNMKILSHFSRGSRSPFLLQLLDKKQRKPIAKGPMNMFLYHLHRRTNVQYRILNLSQDVLDKSYMKLRLCSKAHARQMCVHCIELSDRALELRDDAKTLLNLHISLQSFRANELMAVLTKFSAFFTPCSFLAAVYGMNFKYMPEFAWSYGYIYYWAMCFLIILFIFLYMRNRGLLY